MKIFWNQYLLSRMSNNFSLPPPKLQPQSGRDLQFAGDSVRKDVVCRGDGVGRHQEPGQGENLSCVAVFILVYFFSQVAAVWTQVEKLPEGKRQRRESDGGRRQEEAREYWWKCAEQNRSSY